MTAVTSQFEPKPPHPVRKAWTRVFRTGYFFIKNDLRLFNTPPRVPKLSVCIRRSVSAIRPLSFFHQERFMIVPPRVPKPLCVKAFAFVAFGDLSQPCPALSVKTFALVAFGDPSQPCPALSVKTFAFALGDPTQPHQIKH